MVKDSEKASGKTRHYNSPRRQEQANNTKARIISAAIHQLKEKGYADMSLEDIAKEAGVALQTVYGVCGSKKGVLKAIEENFPLTPEYHEMRFSPEGTAVGAERFRHIGRHATAVLESREDEYLLALSLGAASTRYADLSKELEESLYERCQTIVAHLHEDGLLRKNLDEETAAEILWALHAPGLHRRLYSMKGWTRERFEAWFAELVGAMLLDAEEAPNLMAEWLPDKKKN